MKVKSSCSTSIKYLCY